MIFVNIFFILMSLIVVTYLVSIFKSKERLPILIEIFFILAYLFVALIFSFPETLDLIEKISGVQSAINYIIYTSIFVAYFLILILYKQVETQRKEITKLVREIAINNKKK